MKQIQKSSYKSLTQEQIKDSYEEILATLKAAFIIFPEIIEESLLENTIETDTFYKNLTQHQTNLNELKTSDENNEHQKK